LPDIVNTGAFMVIRLTKPAKAAKTYRNLKQRAAARSHGEAAERQG
jgi:hypothetical protein